MRPAISREWFLSHLNNTLSFLTIQVSVPHQSLSLPTRETVGLVRKKKGKENTYEFFHQIKIGHSSLLWYCAFLIWVNNNNIIRLRWCRVQYESHTTNLIKYDSTHFARLDSIRFDSIHLDSTSTWLGWILFAKVLSVTDLITKRLYKNIYSVLVIHFKRTDLTRVSLLSRPPAMAPTRRRNLLIRITAGTVSTAVLQSEKRIHVFTFRKSKQRLILGDIWFSPRSPGSSWSINKHDKSW